MKNALHKVYLQISNIGIIHDLPYLEKVRIQLVNLSLIVILIATTVGILFYNSPDPALGQKTPVLLLIGSFIPPLISLALSYFQHFFSARTVLTFLVPAYLFLLHISFGKEAGIEFTYFGFAFGILILYDNWKLTLVNFTYVVLLMVMGIYISTHYDAPYAWMVNRLDLIRMGGATLIVLTIGINRFFQDIKKHQDILSVKNQELEQQNIELEKSLQENNRKTELLGIVAHDLRGTAISYRGLAKKINFLIQQDEQEKLNKLAIHFDKTGDNLFYNLDNLLNWVLSQKNKIEIHPQQFLLFDLVEEVIKNVSLQYVEKEIVIKNSVPTPSSIFTDPNVIKVILFNLISNAVKYSDGQVRINCAEERTHFLISVENNGKEIPPILLEQIRSRSHQKKISSQGYGLGLSICYALVDDLRGELFIDSKAKEGTSVRISLKREKE